MLMSWSPLNSISHFQSLATVSILAVIARSSHFSLCFIHCSQAAGFFFLAAVNTADFALSHRNRTTMCLSLELSFGAGPTQWILSASYQSRPSFNSVLRKASKSWPCVPSLTPDIRIFWIFFCSSLFGFTTSSPTGLLYVLSSSSLEILDSALVILPPSLLTVSFKDCFSILSCL